MKESAQNTLQRERDNILDLAEKRAEIMTKLLALSDVEYLTPAAAPNNSITLLLSRNGKVFAVCDLTLQGDTGEPTFGAELLGEPVQGLSPDAFRTEPWSLRAQRLAEQGVTVALLECCSEIPWQMEVLHVLERHFNEIRENP